MACRSNQTVEVGPAVVAEGDQFAVEDQSPAGIAASSGRSVLMFPPLRLRTPKSAPARTTAWKPSHS
jgi:hypothetical protein